MKRTRIVLRAVFLLLAVSLLANLNRKTNDKAGTIANFKYKMIEKQDGPPKLKTKTESAGK